MNQRVLVALAALGVLCAMAFWLFSHGRYASVQPITPPAADTAERVEAHALTQTPLDPELHRAALDASSASAPTTSNVPPISAGMALVQVLVVATNTHEPVSGARVYSTCDCKGFGDKGLEEKYRARGVPFDILVTDANGRAEIETPANVKSDLVARGEDESMGFATREIAPLVEGLTFDVTIEIGTQADLPFWVKVVDETTQSPLAGVRIVPRVQRQVRDGKRIVAVDDPADRPVETDALGLAKVEARSWEQANLDLQAKGRAELSVITESGHERADTALVVDLPLSATLRVHAVLASGAPAAGADVNFSAHNYELIAKQQASWFGSGTDRIYRTNLDDAGRATLADLPPRVKLSVDVRGPCKWKAPEPIVLGPGEVRDVEWSITEGCEIRGTVVDQLGKPVVLQAIWMRKPDVQKNALFQPFQRDQTLNCVTDSAGRFSIARVSAGSWWIGPAARAPGEEKRPDDVAPLAQLLDIAPAQTTVEMTLRVDRGLYIRGHVLDSSARPAKSVYVHAYDRSQGLLDHTNSGGEDGAFSIGPLMNGSYVVTAGGANGDAGSASVTARPGEDDVVLRLVKGASISGRVIGDDGNGVAGILRIANHDTKQWGTEMLTVPNDGTFTLDGHVPGTFDLSAWTTNGSIGYLDSVELAPGGAVKNLVVHVSAGGMVRVREDGPESAARVSILQRGIVVGGDYLEAGKARECPSPVGSVVVRVHYHGEDGSTVVRTAERSIDVKAGETVDVVFEKDAH